MLKSQRSQLMPALVIWTSIRFVSPAPGARRRAGEELAPLTLGAHTNTPDAPARFSCRGATRSGSNHRDSRARRPSAASPTGFRPFRILHRVGLPCAGAFRETLSGTLLRVHIGPEHLDARSAKVCMTET